MLEGLDIVPSFLAVFMPAVVLLAPGGSGFRDFRSCHRCLGNDWFLGLLTVRGRLGLGFRLEGFQPGQNLLVLRGELVEDNLLSLELLFEGLLYKFLEDTEGMGVPTMDKSIAFSLGNLGLL